MNSFPVVLYQLLADGNGLDIHQNMLRAHVDGDVIASVPVSPDAHIDLLMRNYVVLGLLPELQFSFVEPTQYEMSVTMDMLSLPGEVSGVLTLDGEEHFWSAECRRHPDFLRLDEIPPSYKPYITEDGKGFHYVLAASIQTHPDRVLHKRIACVLDDFLRALDEDAPVEYPYIRHFNSVFSLQSPVWYLNVPRVVSLEERNRGSYA
jgi:hypothetical protein